MEKNYTGVIPENVHGKEMKAMASADFGDEESASEFYKVARKRLLFVNEWETLTDVPGADFQLTDVEGNEISGEVKKGYFFRIDIPGPGSKSGEGYDWVRVEEVKEVNDGSVDSIAVLVHPAPNPKGGNDDVAHFYSEHSSSTFVVTREGKKVTAAVYDKNIEVNDRSEGVVDKIRNAIVGTSAKHAFSKVQWKVLVEGIVKKDRRQMTDDR